MRLTNSVVLTPRSFVQLNLKIISISRLKIHEFKREWWSQKNQTNRQANREKSVSLIPLSQERKYLVRSNVKFGDGRYHVF